MLPVKLMRINKVQFEVLKPKRLILLACLQGYVSKVAYVREGPQQLSWSK